MKSTLQARKFSSPLFPERDGLFKRLSTHRNVNQSPAFQNHPVRSHQTKPFHLSCPPPPSTQEAPTRSWLASTYRSSDKLISCTLQHPISLHGRRPICFPKIAFSFRQRVSNFTSPVWIECYTNILFKAFLHGCIMHTELTGVLVSFISLTILGKIVFVYCAFDTAVSQCTYCEEPKLVNQDSFWVVLLFVISFPKICGID